MLTLNRRDCCLGLKATTDGTEPKEDVVELKTLSLTLTDVMLNAAELNALLCEPHAHDVLYNTGTKPIEPYLNCLKELELKDASEHAYVRLIAGLTKREFVFTDAKLSKIKLSPCIGGRTALSCKVTAVPVLDESLAELFEHLGKLIECEIRADLPGAQQDLALNSFGVGETREGAAALELTREKVRRGLKASSGKHVGAKKRGKRKERDGATVN